MNQEKFETLEQWLQWQEKLHPKTIDLGLERPARVLQRLSLPETSHQIFTVAGTNGKGSTVAFLEAIYLAAGYRVGAYTSPHIVKYNERIRINGEEVYEQEICDSFERINRVRKEISLSYFEFGTLAAIDIFSRHTLDVVILEVGLGGRLDAVNIIDPNVAVITPVDIDHTDWLGHDRESIAIEKAGIMRQGRPVVCSDPNPTESISTSARALNAQLFQLGRDYTPHFDNGHWCFMHNQAQIWSELPMPRLKGQRQIENCSGALMAIKVLESKLPVSEQSIAEGIKNAHVTGRFQIINESPLILIDVAHNLQSTKFLAENLMQLTCEGKRIAVVAMLNDKDQYAVINELKPLIDQWHIAPLNVPRGGDLSPLQQVFESLAIHQLEGHSDVTEAYITAKQSMQSQDQLIIFGSFYTVAAVLGLIESQRGNPFYE